MFDIDVFLSDDLPTRLYLAQNLIQWMNFASMREKYHAKSKRGMRPITNLCPWADHRFYPHAETSKIPHEE